MQNQTSHNKENPTKFGSALPKLVFIIDLGMNYCLLNVEETALIHIRIPPRVKQDCKIIFYYEEPAFHAHF